jgi:hypothetical protein
MIGATKASVHRRAPQRAVVASCMSCSALDSDVQRATGLELSTRDGGLSIPSRSKGKLQ